MSFPQKEAGGYDVNFVDEVDDELKCAVCCLVLRNPIQVVNCGHCFCKSCLDKMQEYAKHLNTELICPIDREPVDMQRVFQDKKLSRMVGKLRTYCSNQGCGHVIDLQDLHNHEEACEYRETVPQNPVADSGVSLGEILNRLQRCECELEAKDKELLQLKFSVKELKEENIAIRQELRSMKKTQEDESATKDDIIEVKKHLDSKVERMDRSVKVLDSKNIDLQQTLGVMEGTLMKSKTYNEKIQDVKDQVELTLLEKVRKLVDPVSAKLSALSSDVVYIKGETNKAVKETRSARSHLDKSLNKKNDEIDVLHDKVDQMHKKQENIDNMERVMLAFDNPTPCNTDIVLKWVVEDFKQICNKVGENVRSPMFNTHISGYFFRLRLHVNKSKTDIGIFLELHCKSDHPRPLPLFNNAYTLTLYGKMGSVKSDKVNLENINLLRDYFTISDGSTMAAGAGNVRFLSSPYDEFVVNNSLLVTCTIHL